ncbi:MAG: hypothetical protein U0U66_11715 [Cytophagaceae bacterium]
MDKSSPSRKSRGTNPKVSVLENGFEFAPIELLRIEKKFVDVVTKFIQGVFNYENIKVEFQKKDAHNETTTEYFSGLLESENEHTKFYFARKLFQDKFYEFTVSNIPATTDSRHIQIFFKVLMQYLSYFYDSVQNDLSGTSESENNPNYISKGDIWLYNIRRIIIVEYIYHLFNTHDENYSDEFTSSQDNIRYDLDLVNTIFDFAHELSTKKVENKEICCGFIFHDNVDEVKPNSVRCVRFHEPFNFGDFGQLKNFLDLSNGQNIFFNVTNDKVTHLFVTRDRINKIYFNPIGDEKTFKSRPLILSIQGNGKIHFLEGRSDQNRIILQIMSTQPFIRDNNFFKKFIYKTLQSFSDANDE